MTTIEVQRLKEKCERQADLIERLTAQNGNLQYEKREVVRLSDQAFKILGQIVEIEKMRDYCERWIDVEEGR